MSAARHYHPDPVEQSYAEIVREIKYRTGLRIAMNMAQGAGADDCHIDQMIGWSRARLYRYLCREWGFSWNQHQVKWE